MNLLIIESNFLLKESFFPQIDLKKNINLTFSSSVNNVKKIVRKKNFDFIIISSLGLKLNSFSVITNIFKSKPKNKIIQILDKNNDSKHNFSTFYLTKPLAVNKLLLILLKTKKINPNKKKFFNLKKGLMFNKSQRKIFYKKKNSELILTEKESEIIEYLIKEKKFTKKNNLLEKIWGFNNKVKTRTLETHIYRLRKKIVKNFNIKNFIIVKDNSYKLF